MAFKLYWGKSKNDAKDRPRSADAHKLPRTDMNRTGKTLKIATGGLVALRAGDRVHCTEGRIWITVKGGRELALAAGSWAQISEDAREVWLSALSESTVRLVARGNYLSARTFTELAPYRR